MPDQTSHHLSYLVRIWKDSGDGEWHATLQDIFEGNRYHFASLHELYVNLLALASDTEDAAREPDVPRKFQMEETVRQ